MNHGNYDATADIFSFGIVITEAIAAEEAEEIVDNTRTRDFGIDIDRVKQQYCQELSCGAKIMVEKMVDLAAWCCALEPADRPTTDQVAGRLQRIQLEYQAKRLKTTRRSVPLHSPPKLKTEFLDAVEDDSQSDNTGPAFDGVEDTDSLSVDPREHEAARRIFHIIDKDQDGYLDYSETQMLAKVSDDFELTPTAYNDICSIVGAESEKGLSQELVIQMYTHLKIGDATADLEKLSEGRDKA